MLKTLSRCDCGRELRESESGMERETGIEPVTSSLGSWRSTAELLPLAENQSKSSTQGGQKQFDAASQCPDSCVLPNRVIRRSIARGSNSPNSVVHVVSDQK